jgi:hypothetical protein
MEDKISTDMLKQNIPGVSWTLPPKSLPWQRPPKHAAVSDVLQMYIEKFSSPEAVEGVVDFLRETKLPLAVAAESIMLIGVHKGMHTIDAGILIMPVLVELMKTAAMLEGIELPTYTKDLAKKEKAASPEIIDAALKQAFSSLQTVANEENVTPPSGGLMSKKNKEVM